MAIYYITQALFLLPSVTILTLLFLLQISEYFFPFLKFFSMFLIIKMKLYSPIFSYKAEKRFHFYRERYCCPSKRTMALKK